MIVYTGGTFDLFHRGHAIFLKNCRKIAGENGRVVVSLNTDDFVERFKNKRPTMTYEERKAVLEACMYVDEIIKNEDGEDSKPAILKIKPDVIVASVDWAVRDYYKQMTFTQEWLDKHNILLCYIPYTKNISSTDIRARMASAYEKSKNKKSKKN